MRIYFDTCSLNRPLDDRSQLRVNMEAEAVLGVLSLCEAGAHVVVSSEALHLENERNPQPQRKTFVGAILEQATDVIMVDDAARQRARNLEKDGFKAFDALHLACAEGGKVDRFCTCDDRLLRNARRRPDLAVKVVSPLELAEEMSE